MNIKDLFTNKNSFLAPMAGVTDAPFRDICVSCSASATVSEMVSAKAVTLGDNISLQIASRSGVRGPYGVQIFSNDPYTASEAVKRLYDADIGADWFDLNCGCPAPKIVNNGCGSTLMKTPSLIGEIVSAMEKASPLPVTVKIRAGFSSDSLTAVECAKAAEENGALAVAVHGRTRDRMYAPPVDLDIIAKVKESVSVPVIGNGDIFTPEDAKRMYEYTSCDGIMIGRGALGRPFFFTQVKDYLEKGEYYEPNPREKAEFMLTHIRALCESEGERSAILKARKHAAWYTKGVKNAAAIRREMNAMTSFSELTEFAKRFAFLETDESALSSSVSVGNFCK